MPAGMAAWTHGQHVLTTGESPGRAAGESLLGKGRQKLLRVASKQAASRGSRRAGAAGGLSATWHAVLMRSVRSGALGVWPGALLPPLQAGASSPRSARQRAISMPTYVRAVALAEQYCSASGQRRLCHTVQVEQVGSCWQKCQENTSPNNQNSFNSAYPIIVPHFTCKLNVGVRGACQQNYTVLYRR